MGWNGSGSSNEVRLPTADAKKSSRKQVGIVLCFVLLAGIICTTVAIVFFNKTVQRSDADESKNSSRKPLAIAAQSPANLVPVKKGKVDLPVKYHHGKKIVSETIETNLQAQAIVCNFKTEDGKSHTKVTDIRKRVFDNQSDEFLAMVVGTPPGECLPTMPVDSTIEADFINSLKKDIVLEDDDSTEVKELKRGVIALRNELKNLIESNPGMTVREALEKHQNAYNANNEFRNEVVTMVKQMIAEGDYEGAGKFADKANDRLEEIGAMPVAVPKKEFQNLDASTIKKLKRENSEME